MASLYLLRILLFSALGSLPYLDSVRAQDFSSPREDEDKYDNLWFNFVTRPDIQAPKFEVRVYDEGAISPGYWFVAPYEDHNRFQRGKPFVGPYIYDGNGSLVWSGTPFFDRFKLWDFRVAEFEGVSMMTANSHRENGGMIVNSNYEFVKTVSWKPEFVNSNMHEFNVIDHGLRALVLTAYPEQNMSLERSMEVGFDGHCKVEHHGIMELDISVDPPETLFEWNGVDHIGLDETTQRPHDYDYLCTHNWDLHHFNSLDKFPDGDYLVSGRHTSTIYKVSHIDGSIVWRLGGVKSDFAIPENVVFSRQHHARFREQNATHIIISFFDNGLGWDNQPTNDHSRGVIVALHTEQMTAELLVEAAHPLNEMSEARGDFQLLPGGNLFVGWSKAMRISEHSPNGTLLLHAHTKKKELGTYRAYKFPWVGHPKQPPNVYAAAFVGGTEGVRVRMFTKVAVSWNGATEVKSWKLYTTNEQGRDIECVQEKQRQGFETHFTYDGWAERVVVEALDGRGEPIGRSEVVHTLPPVEEGSEMNETTIAKYITGDCDQSWVVQTLTNPVSTFVAGFVACAVIWFVLRFTRRPKPIPWWRPKGLKYSAVNTKEHGALLEDTDEDDYNSIELSNKTYT